MKPLAICILTLALASPAAARADERAHRLTVAGAVLSAAGGSLTATGVGLVTYGQLNPPAPYPSLQPRFCSVEACGSVPGPTNWPLVGGVATLAVGAAALGTGIALVVVGRRAERPSVALSAAALRVRF